MALPTVTFDNLTVLLGTFIPATDVFSGSDTDGDVVTDFELRDNDAGTLSSYFTFDGSVVAPGAWFSVSVADIAKLVLHAGTVIGQNAIQVRAKSKGEWGPIADALVRSAQDNSISRPELALSDLSVVQSELMAMAPHITANDPDGHAIKRFKVYESNPGALSGSMVLSGATLAPNAWHYVNAADVSELMFKAAAAAPNFDEIWVRAFDGELWSLADKFRAYTTLNVNRPVGIPTETVLPTRGVVAFASLFGWSDADNNTIKKLRWFDATIHGWSGNARENGFDLPGGQWVERDVADLPNLEWVASARSFNEQVRFQVFDGNHWSNIETFRVMTNEKPSIQSGVDYTIRQQLEFLDVSSMFTKGDFGPIHTKYRIFDAETNLLSGDFRSGAHFYEAGVVHELTNQEFLDLEFKTGVFEARSLDDFYIQAWNGIYWSDWTRHTVRTEPEYLDSLAAGSWLNFRGQQNGKVRLTFSYMQDFPDNAAGDATEGEFISPWDPMRELTRQAFERIEEIVDIDFEEVPDSIVGPHGFRGGDIRIGTYCLADSPVVAYAQFPNANGSQMWFNRWHTGTPPNTNNSDPPCGFPTEDGVPPGWQIPLDAWDKGSPNYAVFIHELGHALGLKHPFDPSPILPAVTNSGFFTHMSYTGASFPEWGQQLYDISALQAIYGANDTFNGGDNTYNAAYWRGSLDRVDSIWDTGGTDVIDFSGQGNAANIDLRPGAMNTVGQGSFSIAFGVDIENGTGGSAGDRLTGNEKNNTLIGNGGDDVLEGYGGDDLLAGGNGRDRYIYKMDDGNDTINEGAGATPGGGRDTIVMGIFHELNDFSKDVRFTKRDFDLEIEFAIDETLTRGSITIENQGFGRFRVESLDILGVTVDLKYLYENITEVHQQFALTSTAGQYGLLVAPV